MRVHSFQLLVGHCPYSPSFCKKQTHSHRIALSKMTFLVFCSAEVMLIINRESDGLFAEGMCLDDKLANEVRWGWGKQCHSRTPDIDSINQMKGKHAQCGDGVGTQPVADDDAT